MGTVVQALGKDGAEVSNHMIFNALSIDTEQKKARVRARIGGMVRHGELTRMKDGVYVYNFNRRPRNPRTYCAIWRFVRKAKPGWSLNDVCTMTRVSYTQVRRYCDWLQEEGYISTVGREKNSILYRASHKADLNPETPFPPLRETNPFEQENNAAVQIINALLKQDPYSVKTAKIITKAARTLLERFEKTITQSENEGEDND